MKRLILATFLLAPFPALAEDAPPPNTPAANPSASPPVRPTSAEPQLNLDAPVTTTLRKIAIIVQAASLAAQSAEAQKQAQTVIDELKAQAPKSADPSPSK